MITDRDRALLRLALLDSRRLITQDLEIIGDRTLREAGPETSFLHDLPPAAFAADGRVLAGFLTACTDLIDDLEHDRDPEPRCTAEELVLHLTLVRLESLDTDLFQVIIDAALRDVPGAEGDFDWGWVRESLYQDEDYYLLYPQMVHDPELSDKFYELGALLKPQNGWFAWFANVTPRRPRKRVTR